MVMVLIADNDPGVRGLLTEVVRRQGCSVAAANDGLAAQQALAAAPVDILVCDLDMPRLGGLELLAWLATQPVQPAVVVVSGFVDARTAARLDELACVRAVLRKPFDVLAFAARIRELAAVAASAVPVAAAAAPSAAQPAVSPAAEQPAGATVVSPACASAPVPSGPNPESVRRDPGGRPETAAGGDGAKTQ